MAKAVIVMSDIHGNLPALRAVAVSLPPHDAVVVAGDHCLEGPRPAQVLELLLEAGWSLVLGNTDRDIVSPPDDLKKHKSDMVHWARRQLGEGLLRKLADLPFSLTVPGENGEAALVVHANPRNLDDHLYPTMGEEELDPYFRDVREDILAFGHLHVPYVRPVGGRLLIDVASVGHPKDKDLRAAYTVLTWEGKRRSVTQVRVPYDVEETVALMRKSGMPGAEKEIASLFEASY
jgi:predicted phosphodiesterase